MEIEIDFSGSGNINEELEECHTYDDLELLASQHQYKAGWAYYKAQELGIEVPQSIIRERQRDYGDYDEYRYGNFGMYGDEF